MSDGIAACISKRIRCLVFNYYVRPFGQNLPVCTLFFRSTFVSSCSQAALHVCEYQFSGVSMPDFLHVEKCGCAQTSSSSPPLRLNIENRVVWKTG
jgi:hypothetical protein